MYSFDNTITEENEHFVFVYGSLKSGFERNDVFRNHGSDFLGTSLSKENIFTMYSLGTFPCVTINGNNKIFGELYYVNNSCLEILDQIEGHPRFYERQEHYFNLIEDGKENKHDPILAWIYLIPNLDKFTYSKERIYIANNTSCWMMF